MPITRGKDGRLDVSPEINSKYPISTYNIIASEDFWPRFKPDFAQPCAHEWDHFLGDLEGFKDPANSTNKLWHLWPGHVGSDQAKLYKYPGFTETFLEAMQFKDEFVEHGQKVLEEVKGT